MNYVLQISLEGAEKTDAALNNLIKKVGSIASGDLSNIQMDKLIDDSGILKAGEVGAEKFVKGFGGKMRGYNTTFKELWKNILPMPEFMQDPGFFTRGIKSNNAFKGLREVGGKDLAKVLGLGDFNTNVSGQPKKPNQGIDPQALMVGAMATLFNPFVGARMLSNAFPKQQGGGGNGLFGAAGALGYGEIFVIIKSLGFAFNELKKEVQKIDVQYKRAADFYSHVLQGGGLSLGFMSQKKSLSSILGVPETEVFKFGFAIKDLAQKTKLASDSIAGTTRQLTAVEQQRRLAKLNEEAFNAEQARTYSAITHLFARSDVAGYGLDVKIRKAFNDMLDKFGLLGPSAASPMANMKQMPASHWEKMGLVAMGGTSQNYAHDTAVNTKETARGIAQLLTIFMGPKKTMNKFDLSPLVANP